MIIKKFQGKTENEATEMAKKELGNNVVIMNVRNVKPKGLFSFLKKQTVEVTVALEDEPERPVAVRREAVKETPVKERESSAGGQSQPLVAAIAEGASKSDSSAIEEKLDSLHTLLEQQLQRPEDVKEGESEEEEEPDELERFMKLVYNTMLENEVNETYANQIIDEIEKLNKPGMPFDFALSNVYQKMVLKFGKPGEITFSGKGPKVVFFIGPTGVGKTTTIAKIASKFASNNRQYSSTYGRMISFSSLSAK